MPKYYLLDDNKNLVEGFDKEGFLALLQQAIHQGTLENIDPESAVASKLRSVLNGTTHNIEFVTQAQYNELEAQEQLVPNTYYFITDDTTLEGLEENLNDAINRLSNVEDDVAKIKNGTQVVGNATHATNADNATNANNSDEATNVSQKIKGKNIPNFPSTSDNPWALTFKNNEFRFIKLLDICQRRIIQNNDQTTYIKPLSNVWKLTAEACELYNARAKTLVGSISNFRVNASSNASIGILNTQTGVVTNLQDEVVHVEALRYQNKVKIHFYYCDTSDWTSEGYALKGNTLIQTLSANEVFVIYIRSGAFDRSALWFIEEMKQFG